MIDTERPLPGFWKGSVADVEEAVASAHVGNARVIARSPGGRKVHVVAYGSSTHYERRANYGSATGARNPSHYANKPEGGPPVVYIVGTPHGQEVENIVGTVNLMRVAETGRDWRGREWPDLASSIRACRLLIVPLSNPDGRARCNHDSFVGLPVDEMTRVGQGTREDGSMYGWPGAKAVHPMTGDVGLLGAYFNDDGINLMHDDFFDPMADETRGVLGVARDEAPDYIINLHSHGQAPMILSTAYVPRFHKEIEARFGTRLQARLTAAGLPAGAPPSVSEDGENYPPPSFNLTSALHHVCGAVSLLHECPHGVAEDRYPNATHDDILDIQLILFEELLAFALECPRPGANANR